MGDVQDKSDAYAALADTDIDSYLDGILNENKIECDCEQWTHTQNYKTENEHGHQSNPQKEY